MSGPHPIPGGWTRAKFYGVAGMLCVIQAGLIFLFLTRGHTTSIAAAATTSFRMLDRPLTSSQLTRLFFAIDPTVFPLASSHGFSKGAWLDQPPEQLQMPVKSEEPAWLMPDVARLGNDLPNIKQTKSALPLAMANAADSGVEPWPAGAGVEQFRTQSLVEIEGELAGRQLNAPTGLPAVTNAQLLGSSVVQIAVGSDGQVVAARLMDPRSGSVEADNKALAEANRLRFRPSPSHNAVWGRVVFEWQTAEPVSASPGSTP
jgi:hypothetical protein